MCRQADGRWSALPEHPDRILISRGPLYRQHTAYRATDPIRFRPPPPLANLTQTNTKTRNKLKSGMCYVGISQQTYC